ncbi:hypothetical protein BZL30_0196 [Mycobacterium kansasii]|uniref:Uncharacterized protein n=1 Tax=Mycobacterium kansasii TaxID=1768 RepID=A0A1V3XVC9_MYCKA|nr:hypothetical protein BZL30_0196 [Mycobacterium kansasii]OOK83183.1 hypothetical protein BZL29_1609 [Mycobacterium kansasii]
MLAAAPADDVLDRQQGVTQVVAVQDNHTADDERVRRFLA